MDEEEPIGPVGDLPPGKVIGFDRWAVGNSGGRVFRRHQAVPASVRESGGREHRPQRSRVSLARIEVPRQDCPHGSRSQGHLRGGSGPRGVVQAPDVGRAARSRGGHRTRGKLYLSRIAPRGARERRIEEADRFEQRASREHRHGDVARQGAAARIVAKPLLLVGQLGNPEVLDRLFASE